MGRPIVSSAVGVSLLVLLSACSGASLQKSGLDIKNAAEPLQAAEDNLQKLFKMQLDQKLLTQSPDTHCFYVKRDAKSKEIESTLTCGPYRRLGQPLDHAWINTELTFKQTDKTVTAVVGDPIGHWATADATLLVRPDGKKPVAPESAPDPLAPETTAKNVAAAVEPELLAQVSFTDLPKPLQLITPAATVQISASSQLERVPGDVLAALEIPKTEGMASEYRVGGGQKLMAYRVKLVPTEGRGAPVEVRDSSSDASTSLGMVIGGRKIPIKRVAESASASPMPTSSSSGGTMGVACYRQEGSYSSYKTYPCGSFPPYDYVLLVMHDADQQPAITASVNGAEQTLDLASGEVRSGVSMVDYSRTAFTMNGGATLDPGTVKPPPDQKYSSECSSTAVKVKNVTLSGFDPYANWAKPGRAWLTVDVLDSNMGSYCSSYKTDYTSSVVLSVDGKEQGAAAVNKEGLRFTFDVSADFEKGQFGWRPRGRVSSYPNGWDFAAPNRATLDISIPK